MRVTCLTKRWGHHTPSGGYDRLAQEIGGPVVRRISHPGDVWVNRFWVRVTPLRYYLSDYRYGDWLAEWSLLIKAKFNRPDIVHVLYGDEQLDVLLRRRRLLSCPLVATFHLPVDVV